MAAEMYKAARTTTNMANTVPGFNPPTNNVPKGRDLLGDEIGIDGVTESTL